MRQFKLINGNGATYDMMRKDGFFYTPAGLGWGYETAYIDVGGAYIPTETTFLHPAPSGVMVFANYSVYDEFLKFIQVGGLKLCYMPLNTWLFLDVSAALDKTEINHETNKLECEIEFSGLSHWYAALRSYRAGVSNNYGAKKYDYKYDTDTPDGNPGYIYPSTVGRADISNGSLTSYCKIIISGPAVNPVWALYDSNGNQLQNGKVSATIPAGDCLVVNSRPREMEIAEYILGGARVGSLYTYSDFSTDRFITIPPGDGYYMTFNDDGGAMGDCYVQVYERG